MHVRKELPQFVCRRNHYLKRKKPEDVLSYARIAELVSKTSIEKMFVLTEPKKRKMYVFANPQCLQTHLKDVRRAWPKALKAAGIEFFWLYDLRHTFASRLTEAGVSPIFVAQIMGHASPNILQTYAKANDEFRRAAICSLEAHREAQCEKLRNQHPQMIQ